MFAGAGGNEVVRLEERPSPPVGPEDVVIAARFAALNPADLLQRAGKYPAPPGSVVDIPGLEVAGTVLACGDRVTRFRVGDRAFGIVGGGGLAEHVQTHERLLAPIPDSLGEQEAAAIPEAFITAHDAIVSQAGLRPGEALLVHGAGGGVGTAAVQIGVGMGAVVFGTVRNDAARTAVAELGGTALDDDAFVEQVGDRTGGRGVNVVLELVGAPHFPGNLEVLAACGRIVVVGVGAGNEVNLSLQSLMQKRASMRGTVLRGRVLEEKALAVRAFEREVLPALAGGQMRPLIDAVYPADQFAAAFDRMSESGKVGKVLLDFG